MTIGMLCFVFTNSDEYFSVDLIDRHIQWLLVPRQLAVPFMLLSTFIKAV